MANFTDGLQPLPYLKEEDALVSAVPFGDGDIKFLMYGATTEFRVRTIFTKEPETVEWIKSFKRGDVLWDIGANIGCYSMIAAKNGTCVVSFEPSPVNYWILTSNSSINEFNELITSLPFGLSDITGVQMWSPNIFAGSADNQINSQQAGCALQTYRIDDLVAMDIVKFPQHIKLDVDGIERLILEGAEHTLADQRLKSVLCEVDESNLAEIDAILKLMASKGFSVPIKRHAPYYDEYHYAPMFNYLFYRL
jgi:FkbM family methyltransferase